MAHLVEDEDDDETKSVSSSVSKHRRDSLVGKNMVPSRGLPKNKGGSGSNRKLGGSRNMNEYKIFLERNKAIRLVLGVLNPKSMKKHLARLLDVESVGDKLSATIDSRTGGNMLYIQEMIASLIDNGLLVYSGDTVELKEVSERSERGEGCDRSVTEV